MKLGNTPYWTHDCTRCAFLGQSFTNNRTCDWYRCDDTIIGRVGDDGPDYWSSLETIIKNYGIDEPMYNMARSFIK